MDIDLTLHKHQMDVLQGIRRYTRLWLCGGLGSGKTWVLVLYCAMMLAQWARRSAKGAPMAGLLYEPDFTTYEEVFLPTWRALIPGEDRAWKEYTTRTGSRQISIGPNTLYVRSAMNAQTVMRSEGLSDVGWGAMDEPARMLCGAQAFLNIDARCRVPIEGWDHNPVLLGGSPRGLYHWTAMAFGCVADHPKHGYTSIYEPDPVNHPGYAIRACKTADNAENLSRDYEKNGRLARSPALAEQEYGASLISTQGMIFPEWATQLIVLPNDVADSLWASRALRLFGGADMGTTAPAASHLMAWTGDEELLVIDEWYQSGQTSLIQGAAMWAMQEHWGPRSYATRHYGSVPDVLWWCDPSASDAIKIFRTGFPVDGKTETLSAMPADYQGSASTAANAPKGWLGRVDLVRSLMVVRTNVQHPNPAVDREIGAPRIFIAERCAMAIKEFPGLRTKEQVVGRPPREGAEGPDHAVDSICGAAISTATAVGVRTW